MSAYDDPDGCIAWYRNPARVERAEPEISVKYDVFWSLVDATRDGTNDGDPDVVLEATVAEPGAVVRWRFPDRELIYVIAAHAGGEHGDAYLMRWPD